jgi:ferric-dicitrate binding protein FerR (iron transport regulator)
MDLKNFDANADSLIADALSGNAGRDAYAALKAWLEAGEANRRRFEAMQQAWLAAGALCAPDESAAQGAFARLAQRLQDAPSPRAHRLKRAAAAALRMAAVWATAFAVGALSYKYYTLHKPQQVAHFETIVPLGAKSQLALPDGTKVWLNAGSSLRYSAEYSLRCREVELEGEGYFEVATNKAMPFEVRTSLLNVKAMGTNFNVKAYPSDSVVETILVEGEVEVSRVHGSEAGTPGVILHPKQRLTLLKSTNELLLEVQPKDDTYGQAVDAAPAAAAIPDKVRRVAAKNNYMMTTSWKDRSWRIEDEDLGSLAVKLGRRYNVTISFADEQLKSYHFTGTLEDEPVEAVLKAMTQTAPVSYKFEGSEILLSLNSEMSEHYKSLWNN